MKGRIGARIAIPLAIVAAALSAASVAWACTIYVGATYVNGHRLIDWSNDEVQSLKGGTTASFGAKNVGSGPAAGSDWKVVGSNKGTCCNRGTELEPKGLVRLNRGDADGYDLGPVGRTLPTAKGDYWFCFLHGSYATDPAVVTVT